MQLKPQAEFLIKQLNSPKYREIINKIARKYTRGTSISWEDAAQTAYIKVMEAVKAERFRQGGVEEFYRWTTVVARFEIINFVKKEQNRSCPSLDTIITGTDLSWIDTIPSQEDIFDSVEHTDLIIKVKEAVINLDIRYPQQGYFKLWQGKFAHKHYTELMQDLGVSQGEISRRWKKLVALVLVELGLQEVEAIKEENQNYSKVKNTRKRSKTKW
ncbi:MAG: sigma-70 family RNA polymerase sigma factor [Rivularia sp. ALOHA_DT_140]|nr:sigma-70 family RNA polymerase sigma factor [Rivularia sp. ALOHA_DT_140]